MAPFLWCFGGVEAGSGAALLGISDMAMGLGRTHIRQTLIEIPRPLLRQVRRLWSVLRRHTTGLLNAFVSVHPLIVAHWDEAVAETGVVKDLHSLDNGIGDVATPESVPAVKNSLVELCWGSA